MGKTVVENLVMNVQLCLKGPTTIETPTVTVTTDIITNLTYTHAFDNCHGLNNLL